MVTVAMATVDSNTLLAQLGRADAYAERPREITLHETHISWVFVTENFAYKLKKPVRFDFLDYSTPAARERACQAELRLNRRLAPDVYLDVLPVTRDADGRLRFAGDGETVDWAVRMRRLSDEDRLDHLFRTGHLADADIERVAERLARFYQQAAPLPIDQADYGAAIEAHVRANRRELGRAERRLPAALVQRVHAAQLRLLALAPELLTERVPQGRIIDGHGDLRPEHIYLLDPPVAIDCIEFNDEFRQIDAVDELSFLTMECDFLGAGHVGGRVLDVYCRATGDAPPAVLLAFFKSYRAAVRAKVYALRSDQLQGNERRAALETATEYLLLADRYRREGERPLLIVVGGLMGTGKSTLAAAVGEKLGVAHLQTDAVRRELLGTSEQPASYGEGHYTPESRSLVYRELLYRAGKQLADGLSVVLDGTFLGRGIKAQVAALAADHEAEFYFVHCVCPLDVVRQRIAARAAAGETLSEARPELVEQQQATEESLASEQSTLEVDTTAPLAEQVGKVVGAMASKFSPTLKS